MLYSKIYMCINDNNIDHVINKLTYENLSKYIEDPSISQNGAKYIAHVFNFNNEYNFKLENSDDILLFTNGIYYCKLDSSFESHYFTLIILDNILILLQTYKGVEKIFKTEFDKNEWLDEYINASKENKISYRYIFNLDRKTKINDLSNFELYYSKQSLTIFNSLDNFSFI